MDGSGNVNGNGTYGRKSGLKGGMACLRLLLCALVLSVSVSSLFGFHYAGRFIHKEDLCRYYYGAQRTDLHELDVKALNDRVLEVLDKLDALQEKLENKLQEMEKDKGGPGNSTEYKRYLADEVMRPLSGAHIALRQVRIPRLENGTVSGDPLVNSFVAEEIRNYVTPKGNREMKVNLYGSKRVYSTIGHACVVNRKGLERYMDYEVSSYCKDDWNLAQKLMISGCDPLPRRRCLTRGPKAYYKPYAINESLWKLPNDSNVRWNNYQCKNFSCLVSGNQKRGYFKCMDCFEMKKEKLRWVVNTSVPIDFLIADVLAIKPGEIRVGLDFGIGTGTFAARMREHNVTIITTAVNLGAPFSETIALRGLLPLYITLNQRLPFFDNTLDLIHTSGFFDGWIDLLQMDFVLFDWDRVLRPGGILWIDRFFCSRKDQDDYMYLFLQFRYKKHKWSVYPKSDTQVYLSAVLEKPLRKV
ncbi:hypothetical protein MLD38_035897 [Melastoma candidum]|uniref:Uncharacterized protein n=1 Tax=Melastoma candidum TaxID=119954 RepID=A0ACB9LJV5_9MYRT|nr:hypothetical protein MLD38_035897 [Melastoma candidum]